MKSGVVDISLNGVFSCPFLFKRVVSRLGVFLITVYSCE